jgi:hypothetical protein
MDLVEVKPRIQREAWLNVYPNCVTVYESHVDADKHAAPDRIACVKHVIDCEEGEGIE